MRIGIIGSGNIGGGLGRLWAGAGHEVLFSSRNPKALANLVHKAGPNARAGSPGEAIAFGDVILEAVPFAAAMDLPAEPLAGKTLITASNYYPQRDGEIDLGGRSQSEALAELLPGVQVVKAFNMMFAREIEARADGTAETSLAIYFAGDSANAKSIAAALVDAAKFAAVDAGPLAAGWIFESGGPLYAKLLAASEARQELRSMSAKGSAQ